jgi:phosphoenolpyruvate carboxykinase (ATP)
LGSHIAIEWLINTGLSGGAYGTGQRISLKHTRANIQAIHSGALDHVDTVEDPTFGVAIPTSVPGVPSEILVPKNTWPDADAYDRTARKLASLFAQNFEKYEDGSSREILEAGPRLETA